LSGALHLEEAEKFIQNMPFEPDAIGWDALLGACRSHSNIELGSRVAEQLFKLEPSNAAPYVVLANMYVSSGRWNDVSRVRKMMKDRGIKKQPGCSWIDINKRVHAFIAEDSSQPQMDEIYATLETLAVRMKEAGYVPDTKFALLHDVGEEYKKDVLSHHSEKLALAFGLMNTPSGTTIQIIKNLRVCGDRHTAFKFISMITAREIIVKEVKGSCSRPAEMH
jgi:pentatricopeptide repeat protein